MSIDNIQLTGFICQNLFTNCLISESPENNLNQELNKVKINSLGGNQNHIVFLINNKEHKYLNDNEMKFLSDLLSACKLSMEDISLVNFYQNKNIGYENITEQFQSKTILIFGVSTSELGLPFTIPFFQVQKFQEQNYLTAPSLDSFLENIPLKKQLWNSLKIVFQL